MVFLKHDRQLYVATETTEGTFNGSGVYCEVLDDITFTLEPIALERQVVRPSYTRVPMYHPSDGITSSDTVVSSVTVTARVELAGPSSNLSGPEYSTAADWDPLMKACGFSQIASVKRLTISGGTVTGGPFFHRELCSPTSGTDPRTVSSLFTGDTLFYYTVASSDPAAGVTTGDVSSASCTTTGSPTATGLAYSLSTDAGVGNNSSCSMAFYTDGQTFQLKGCRGNVSWQFTSTDRVIATFTMTGILHNIASGASPVGVTVAKANPPVFVNAGLRLKENTGTTDFTGALFEQMTLDVGNEVVIRRDANSSSGWKAAQIVGRNPTLTINPDAIAGGNTTASVFDFFQKWVAGTECRASWQVGLGLDGNSYHFKAPALQFTGVADGDRDNFMVFDCSAALTGGSYGDSVNAAGTAQLHSNKGSDNELVIICN